MRCQLFLFIIFLSTSIFICTRQDKNEFAVSPVCSNQFYQANLSPIAQQNSSNWYASVQVQSYCQSAYSNRYQQQSHALTENQHLNALFTSLDIQTAKNCQQIFHKTPEQLQALFSLEPVKFKHDLLQDENLPNDLIWKIFDAYQDSCWWWHHENLAEYRQDIQRTLQERNRIKEFYHQRQEQITQIQKILEDQRKIEALAIQKRLQEQKHKKLTRLKSQKEVVRNQMRQLGVDPEQCVYLASDFEILEQEYESIEAWCKNYSNDDIIWQQRQLALEKTKQQNFVQSWQRIDLSAQAQAYLKTLDLTPDHYTQCFGTALQHEVQQQNCKIFELIAQEFFVRPMIQSKFLHQAAECIDASYWANEFEAMRLAMSLQDLGSVCCKLGIWTMQQLPLYTQAIIQGAFESTKDFIHIACHPIEMIQNIAQAIYFIAETVALYDPEVIKYCPQQSNERHELIMSAISSGINNFKEASGPERLQIVTKLTCDCLFQHKAIHAVGTVAGILQTQIKKSCLGSISKKPSLALAGNKSINLAASIEQFTEKFEESIQKNINNEIKKIFKKKTFQNLKLITEADALLYQNQIINELNLIMQKALPEINYLAKKYEWVNVILDGNQQQMKLNIKHIFFPEIVPKFTYDKITQIKKFDYMRWTGWHYGYLQEFENAGFIKIIKKIVKNDCTYVEFTWKHGNNLITKTLFPNHWSREQVIEKILEAMNNRTEIINRAGAFFGRGKTVIGKTKEGIVIEIKLTRESLQDTWSIDTAFIQDTYIYGT